MNTLLRVEIKMNPDINIVIPLFNEEAVFPLLIKRLISLMDHFRESIEVIMVDDGSSDATSELIKELCRSDQRFSGVILSRNYGHQIALTAGLQSVNAEQAVMVIDGDLQDPPELLHKMFERFKEGFEVVYAIRKDRKEGFLKSTLYFLFYRIAQKMAEFDLPLDSGDFALLSTRVVNVLNLMPEESRYLRGMRHWIGFDQIGIEYRRSERAAGKPKYTFKMLFDLAYNGIFNFSEVPIKFVSKLGFFAIGVSIIYFIYTIIMRFYYDQVPSGFTAILFVIILFGGVQLISIGIIGEYIIRIFFQVKGRPLFLVDEEIRNKKISKKTF